MGTPVIFGGNNTSIGLQNRIILANGSLLAHNGAKNYITHGDFETGSIRGWSLANSTVDATSKLPNQASGSWTSASANLAVTASTSGKLAGYYSGQITQSTGASTAGDMLVSDVFDIDKEDQSRILNFKFFYSITAGAANTNFSGTSANSFGVAIYDVTNSVWIQPVGVYNLTQNSGVGVSTGSFQTTSNSTQYRFAIYFPNASTGTFTMLVDDIFLGPQTVTSGIIPKASTVTKYTATGTGTYTTPSGVYQIRVRMSGGGGGGGKGSTVNDGGAGSTGGTSYFRIGASPDLLVANGGAGGSGGNTGGGEPSGGVGGTASIAAPYIGLAVQGGGGHYGWNMIVAQYTPGGAGGQNPLGGAGKHFFGGTYAGNSAAANTGAGGDGGGLNVGSAQSGAGGGAGGYVDVIITNPAASYNFNVGIGGAGSTTGTGGANGGAGGSGYLEIEEYYLGSNVQMSSSVISGIVAASYTRNSLLSIPQATQTVLPFTTLIYDTTSSYNTSTGVYTVPVSGKYKISAFSEFDAGSTGHREMSVYKNGVIVRQLYYSGVLSATVPNMMSGTATLDCVAGDTLAIYVYQDSGSALNAATNGPVYNHLEIELLSSSSGSSIIAASESVNCNYSSTSSPSIGTGPTVIPFTSKYWDSHNAYNTSTGVFTAPISGKYRVSARITITGVTLSTTQTVSAYINKNGTTIHSMQMYGNGAVGPAYTVQITDTVSLLAGETTSISANSSVATSVNSAANYSSLAIERIGN